MFQLPLATNFRMWLRATPIAAVALMVSFAFHGCDKSGDDADAESPGSLTSQILSLDREQAHERQHESDAQVIATEPGTRVVRGIVTSRLTGQPEAGCRISYGGSVTHSDPSGAFALTDIPAGEDARLRFSCRGHIERRSFQIPEGTGPHELDEPVAIGPRRANPGIGPSNDDESVGIAEAIRQMDQEREENTGKPSIFGKAGRGLANFAGTAAAIATGTDDNESGRYRVLGQWKRAELSAEEAEENEGLTASGEDRDEEDEGATDGENSDPRQADEGESPTD